MKNRIIVLLFLLLAVCPLIQAQNNTRGGNQTESIRPQITPEEMEQFHRKIGEALRTDFATLK